MNRKTLAKLARQARVSTSFASSLKVGPGAAVAKLAEHLLPAERDALRRALESRREALLAAIFGLELPGEFSRETGNKTPKSRGGEAVPQAPWSSGGAIHDVRSWQDEPNAPRRLAPRLSRVLWEPDVSSPLTRAAPTPRYRGSSSFERIPETGVPFDPFGITQLTDVDDVPNPRGPDPRGPWERAASERYKPFLEQAEGLALSNPDNAAYQRMWEEAGRNYSNAKEMGKAIDDAQRQANEEAAILQWLGRGARPQDDPRKGGGGSGGGGSGGTGSGGGGGSSGSGGEGGGQGRPDDGRDADKILKEQSDQAKEDKANEKLQLGDFGKPDESAPTSAIGRPSEEAGGERSRIPSGVLHGMGHVGELTPSDDDRGEAPGEGGKFNPFKKRKREIAPGPLGGDVGGFQLAREVGGVARRAGEPRGIDRLPGHGPDDYMPAPDDPGDVGPRGRALRIATALMRLHAFRTGSR